MAKQSGAVEACWAHNPEVRRSKLRSANTFFFIHLSSFHMLSVENMTIQSSCFAHIGTKMTKNNKKMMY